MGSMLVNGHLDACLLGLSSCLLSAADAQLLWLQLSGNGHCKHRASTMATQLMKAQRAFQTALSAELWSTLLASSLGASVSAKWRPDPAALAAWWQ